MSASEIGYFVMSVLHTREVGGVFTTVSAPSKQDKTHTMLAEGLRRVVRQHL